MVKVEVVEGFTLERFDELKNIVRKEGNKDIEGKLFIGDTFECELEMCKYLTGENKLKRAFVKKIEVTPKPKTTRTKKAKTDEKILPKEEKDDTIKPTSKKLSIKSLRKEQR